MKQAQGGVSSSAMQALLPTAPTQQHTGQQMPTEPRGRCQVEGGRLQRTQLTGQALGWEAA